jgi:hypothetical protein
MLGFTSRQAFQAATPSLSNAMRFLFAMLEKVRVAPKMPFVSQ